MQLITKCHVIHHARAYFVNNAWSPKPFSAKVQYVQHWCGKVAQVGFDAGEKEYRPLYNQPDPDELHCFKCLYTMRKTKGDNHMRKNRYPLIERQYFEENSPGNQARRKYELVIIELPGEYYESNPEARPSYRSGRDACEL